MTRAFTKAQEISLLCYAAVDARRHGLIHIAEFFEACIARRLQPDRKAEIQRGNFASEIKETGPCQSP